MNTEKLDRYLDRLPEFGVPACDFTIAKDGKTVYRRLVGYADHAKTRPLSETDLFRVYSVSKITTCICAMQLVEQGKLNLDDPVSKYLPKFADLTVKQADGTVSPARNVLTVRHLFTMTGGFDYNLSTEAIRRVRQDPSATTLTALDALTEMPLHFEPGTRYAYSLCHDILAGVVEVISGMRFSEYVAKYIAAPLGMTDTGFRPSEEQRARLVDAYRFVPGLMKATPVDGEQEYNRYVLCDGYDSGGAGLFTSVNDQMKLLNALANGGTAPDGTRILKPETITLLGKNGLPDSARPDFQPNRLYGYSWGLCGRAHVNKTVSRARSAEGEFGWDGAAGAFALADPTNRVAMYFGIEVLNCAYSYYKLFPDLRDLGYEILGIE